MRNFVKACRSRMNLLVTLLVAVTIWAVVLHAATITGLGFHGKVTQGKTYVAPGGSAACYSNPSQVVLSSSGTAIVVYTFDLQHGATIWASLDGNMKHDEL